MGCDGFDFLLKPPRKCIAFIDEPSIFDGLKEDGPPKRRIREDEFGSRRAGCPFFQVEPYREYWIGEGRLYKIDDIEALGQ